MVLKWLRQTKKPVIFRQNELDQYLLTAIKTELANQPGLSFSSLCKEALHEFLQAKHSQTGQPSLPSTQRIERLEAQLISMEQRCLSPQKNRLERLEAQVQQLAFQMVHLGSSISSAPVPPQPMPNSAPHEEAVEDLPEDPVLSRLSGIIDEF
jgi:hypothetical protein